MADAAVLEMLMARNPDPGAPVRHALQECFALSHGDAQRFRDILIDARAQVTGVFLAWVKETSITGTRPLGDPKVITLLAPSEQSDALCSALRRLFAPQSFLGLLRTQVPIEYRPAMEGSSDAKVATLRLNNARIMLQIVPEDVTRHRDRVLPEDINIERYTWLGGAIASPLAHHGMATADQDLKAKGLTLDLSSHPLTRSSLKSTARRLALFTAAGYTIRRVVGLQKQLEEHFSKPVAKYFLKVLTDKTEKDNEALVKLIIQIAESSSERMRVS